MALPEEFMYQLKQGNAIEDVFSSYVSLKRRGSTYVCLCPFHSEKSASCTVYTDTQNFYCFGCGAGGDVITFIMRIENLSYIEAVRLLAQRIGISVPETGVNDDFARIKAKTYEINRETANFYFKTLLSGNDKRGLIYFKERRLSADTIKKYGLGYSPDSFNALRDHLRELGFHDKEMVTAGVCRESQNGKGCYDTFRGRVMFPIIDLRGNVIAFGGRKIEGDGPKYLNSPDTPVFKKSRNLFSLNHAKNSPLKKLILAEGYMDVISINQAGFENVVATLGTALTPEQARIMAQYANEVIIAYDSDSAGQAATQRAINLLSSAGINTKIIKMTDAKDPDEYIKKFGSTRFKLLLDNSGDAVAFELEKCKNGLDITNENDKVTYLKKTVAVLSELDDALQRDVYISKISKESDINTQILQAQVAGKIKNKNSVRKKQEWKAIENSVSLQAHSDPEAASHLRESKAEELIILYLMKNPDKLDVITKSISLDEFVTDFNKRLFDSVVRSLSSEETFSLTLISEEFNGDEMGRISGIIARNRDRKITEQTFSDCINVLKESKHKIIPSKENEISDDELLNMQKYLQSKR